MDAQFFDFFYHDVRIKKISYDFNSEDGSKFILFVLNDIQNDGFDDVVCLFRNVKCSSVKMFSNDVGDVSISTSEINDNDDFFLEYKNRMRNYLSSNILNELRCYFIITADGSEIKIITRSNIEIINDIFVK